jgi:hypothetical protein
MTPEQATKVICLQFILVGKDCELTIHDTAILDIVRRAIAAEREANISVIRHEVETTGWVGVDAMIDAIRARAALDGGKP